MTKLSLVYSRTVFLRRPKAEVSDADIREANLSGADFREANLSYSVFRGANLREADFRGANLRDTDFRGVNLMLSNLEGADLGAAETRAARLMEANLRGADLAFADLRGAQLAKSNLDRLNLSSAAFDERTDLFVASWQTLRIGGKTFYRETVEGGQEILPFGMGPRLSVIIETARISGIKHEVTMAVMDHLARAGVEAKLEQLGGAGSIIRLAVRSYEDAELLLHFGDGVCRLLGIGTGIENLLPAESRAATKKDLDERFTLAARQQNAMIDQFLDALERIGREDVKSVKLSGFTDQQMEKLRSVIEEVGDILEIKFIEESREAMMTLTQKVSRDVYEMKVAKPLRSLLEAVFSPRK